MQKQNNTEVIYLRLSKELKKKVRKLAREDKVSEVEVCRIAISLYSEANILLSKSIPKV